MQIADYPNGWKKDEIPGIGWFAASAGLNIIDGMSDALSISHCEAAH
jgi:hypothetical protein